MDERLKLDQKTNTQTAICIYFLVLLFKVIHITAYGISVCERMLIRSHMLIYVRGTLGIRRVRSEYADIRLCTGTLYYT